MAILKDPITINKSILKAVNEKAIQEAEPYIRKALLDIETKLRAKVASQLIGLIKQNYNIYKDHNDLVITIKQVFEKD